MDPDKLAVFAYDGVPGHLNLVIPTPYVHSLCFLPRNSPFAVHYEKIAINLRETATNSAKIHSLARKSEHLRINQIQLRFLRFNQHSITFLGIHFSHSTYKREKKTLSLTPTFESLTLS